MILSALIGTTKECVDSILANGFDVNCCADPSFGNGIYFSRCLGFAGGFSDGLILEVQPDLSKTVYVDSYGAVPNTGQQWNALSSGVEYVCLDTQGLVVTAIIKKS